MPLDLKDFLESKAVAELKNPLKQVDSKQESAANQKVAELKQTTANEKQSAADVKRLSIGRKSNADYKYQPNLNFEKFNPAEELQKLVLHAANASGVERNQAFAGKRPGEVANEFNTLAKVMKDTKATPAAKAQALYQAGTYCEMYFQYSAVEEVRVHVRNFFMIKAAELGHIPASIEIAKICLIEDSYLAFNWLSHLMLKGNMVVIKMFQEWYRLGDKYVNKNAEIVESYQKFIEEIERRKIISFIKKLDAKGVDEFIKNLESKKTVVSEKEKTDIEKFLVGLRRHKINGCKAKSNFFEDCNNDKIIKYAELDSDIPLDEPEKLFAEKNLIANLQKNLQKKRLYLLIDEKAKTVAKAITDKKEVIIKYNFIYKLISVFLDKSITLLDVFREIDQAFTDALKDYPDAVAMKFNNKLIAFMDMAAVSMKIHVDKVDAQYEKFEKSKLEDFITKISATDSVVADDKEAKKVVVANLTLGVIKTAATAAAESIPQSSSAANVSAVTSTPKQQP